MMGKVEAHALKSVCIRSERVGVQWRGGVMEGTLTSGKPKGARKSSVG